MALAAIARQMPAGQSDTAGPGALAYLTEKHPDAKDEKALGSMTEQGLWAHMLRTNPVCAVGYLGLLSTMQSVELVIEPHRAGKRIARFVGELLFDRMSQRLRDVTRTMWSCVPMGAAPHEITVYVDGGYTWIRDVSYRPLRSFPQSYIWRDRGGYVHARQVFYRGGPMGSISYVEADFGAPVDWPAQGWLWWPTYGEGLLGTPLLRPVVNEHKNKEDIRRGFGIDVQKILTPTPVVHAKDTGDEDGPGDDEWNDTLEEVGAAASHEEFALGLPSWVEKVTSLFEGRDSEVITRAIEAENHADTQVLLLFGAPYWARGLFSGTGTNAASKVDITEQRNMRRYFLDLGNSWLQQLIDWFVDLNFGEQRFYPEIRAIYHQELDPLARSRVFAAYRGAGFLSVSDADEDWIRAEHGMPKRVDDADPRQVKKGSDAETPGSYDKGTGDDDRDRPPEEDKE